MLIEIDSTTNFCGSSFPILSRVPDVADEIFVLSFQINTAKGILDTILSVQPKESSGGKAGETR